MSEFWRSAEDKLRIMEMEGVHDLFAVGYLIPQVALAEEEWSKEEEPFAVLSAYVDRCIQQDQLTKQDIHLIDDILQQLK